MIALDALIRRGEEFISQIYFTPIPPNIFSGSSGYNIPDTAEYESWKATSRRFIGVHYPNDKAVEEFEQASGDCLSPENHLILLAILKAIREVPLPHAVPKPDTVPMDCDRKGVDIIVNNNNTVNQIQNTIVQYAVFIESIKNGLNDIQLQELKDILDQHKDAPETAKTKIVEKLVSFGTDVLASILGNLMTNPNIYAGF